MWVAVGWDKQPLGCHRYGDSEYFEIPVIITNTGIIKNLVDRDYNKLLHLVCLCKMCGSNLMYGTNSWVISN